VAASASVSLFPVSRVLPWLLSAGAAGVSVLVFGALAPRLPPSVAYRPDAQPAVTPAELPA